MEWPPHSGEKKLFPETDKAAWLNLQDAAEKINVYQLPLLEALKKLLRL